MDFTISSRAAENRTRSVLLTTLQGYGIEQNTIETLKTVALVCGQAFPNCMSMMIGRVPNSVEQCSVSYLVICVR